MVHILSTNLKLNKWDLYVDLWDGDEKEIVASSDDPVQMAVLKATYAFMDTVLRQNLKAAPRLPEMLSYNTEKGLGSSQESISNLLEEQVCLEDNKIDGLSAKIEYYRPNWDSSDGLCGDSMCIDFYNVTFHNSCGNYTRLAVITIDEQYRGPKLYVLGSC